MSQDLDHLRLLSAFHYVVAGFAALVSLIPTIHLAIGLALASGRMPGPQDPMVPVVGWFLVAIALAFILGGLAFATCLALAGRSLARRKRYVFCVVMAALSCMFAPFGTVLGVFTLLVLMRPSVKELFDQAAATPIT